MKRKKREEKTCHSSSNGLVTKPNRQNSPESNSSEKDKNTDHKVFTNIGELSGALFAFLSQGNLLSWLGGLTKAPATIYDKALDAEYLKTHIGGGGVTGFLMEDMTSSMLGAE